MTLIVEAGGDVSPAGPSAGLLGYAASTHSASHDRIPVMQCLLDHGAGIDILRGANIDWNGDFSGDQQVWGRMNALHQSVQSGKKDLVEFLLDRGADIDLKAWGLDTRYKDTSVEDLARICGQEDVWKKLENHRKNSRPL
jgi:ankyrin repeat protein